MIVDGNTYCRVITPILPPEYQEVEYIECGGEQHIDTGYYLTNSNISIKTKIYTSNMPYSEQDIINNQDSSNNRFVVGLYNKKVFGYSKSGLNVDTNVYSQEFNGANTLEIDVNYNYQTHTKILKVNDDITTALYYCEIQPSNRAIALFKNVISNNLGFIGKCYYIEFKTDNILTLNLIPCYRKSDNEIGMYDTVNGVFYTNQGTGTFLKGNNVVHTIRYKIPCEQTIYHIRGTATDNFDFTLKYIDRNNNITTVTEHAVIDENGKWDVSYSGKYIYEMDTFYSNNKKSKITSFEFTEKLDYLHSFNTDLQQYRGIFYDCTNCTEIKFAKGTTFKSVTYCYNPFTNTKLTELDLSDATFEPATNIQGFLNGISTIVTANISKIKSGNVFYGNQSFINCNSLENLYVPQNSSLSRVLNLQYSPLTYDSMLRVCNWIADLTGKTAQTVTFKADTYNALTAEQKATLQNIIVTQKGWNLATA